MDNSSCSCGQNYVFDSRVLTCIGKPFCTIPRDATYFNYQNKFYYCASCFDDLPGEVVVYGDNDSRTCKRSMFQELKNVQQQEAMVKCVDCGLTQHQICALHLKTIWTTGFVCDRCLQIKGVSRDEEPFTAKRLRTTMLSDYLESKVNKFLKGKGARNVTIRVVSCREKSVKVEPKMKARFVESGQFPAEFPYRAKALMAFQETDGVDVCFFGMHVQEYGSDCPSPNTRRVYISYLDSVPFFEPKKLRIAVYYEIMHGYLDHVKQLGYTTAHIWACPPLNEDYIFYAHPTEPKIPTPKRLYAWCKNMLDIGIIKGVVSSYKNIKEQAIEDRVQSPTEFPYFEEDFWAIVMEDIISELDREEEKRKQDEALLAVENASLAELNKEMRQLHCNNQKEEQEKINTQSDLIKEYRDAMVRTIYIMMEKLKHVFFVVRMHSAKSAVGLPPIHDPDPVIINELMDGRDAFLTFASEKLLEFSSLRRAKFSTMAMLFQLHREGQMNFVYTCNNCTLQAETPYHCQECSDFGLCSNCFLTEGHQHRMIQLGRNSEEARKQQIQNFVQFVVDSTKCCNDKCHRSDCPKMRKFVAHTFTCTKKSNGGCSACSVFMSLCFAHARMCNDQHCVVPYCFSFKQKVQHKVLQKQVQTKCRMQQVDYGMIGAPGADSSSPSTCKPEVHAVAPSIQHQPPKKNPKAAGSEIPAPAASRASGLEALLYDLDYVEEAISMVNSWLNLPSHPGHLLGNISGVKAGSSGGSQDWSINKDFRNNYVQKIVSCIGPYFKDLVLLPNFEALTKQEKQMDLESYARKIDGEIFRIARSQFEYVHLLANKVVKILKEMLRMMHQRCDTLC